MNVNNVPKTVPNVTKKMINPAKFAKISIFMILVLYSV